MNNTISHQGLLRGTPTGKGSIIFRGKEYKLTAPLIQKPGDDRIQFGIAVTAVYLKCPMISRQGNWCNTWIEMALDFAPVMYSCPTCSGTIIIDSRAERANLADYGTLLEAPNGPFMFFYFRGQGEEAEIKEWKKRRSSDYIPILATRYDHEGQAWLEKASGGKRIMIAPLFIPLDEEWLDEQQKSPQE